MMKQTFNDSFDFQVDGFLEQLLNYDKENIHESNLKAVQTYLDNPEFDSDLVKGKSLAAGGLCAWTINVIRFYHVYCDVEPKRLSLAQANAELAAAEDKLSKIKAKIKVSFFGGSKIRINMLSFQAKQQIECAIIKFRFK